MESEVLDYIKPGLEKAGVAIVACERYSVTEQEFRSVVTKIKGLNPQEICIIGFGYNFSNILREIKQQGIGSGISGGIGLLEMGGDRARDLAEGAVFVAPDFSISKQSSNSSFIQKYIKEHGKQPPYDGAYAYDTMMVLAKALKDSDLTSQSIRAALLKTQDYEGETGTISILPNGDSRTTLVLAIYKNGVAQILETYKK
jgi:branched-chain amino acid transport system substrate-binding protein